MSFAQCAVHRSFSIEAEPDCLTARLPNFFAEEFVYRFDECEDAVCIGRTAGDDGHACVLGEVRTPRGGIVLGEIGCNADVTSKGGTGQGDTQAAISNVENGARKPLARDSAKYFVQFCFPISLYDRDAFPRVAGILCSRTPKIRNTACRRQSFRSYPRSSRR